MDSVAAIRSFNRFYTERIGALDERFLGQDRPLGEARLLFEIGKAGAPVADLRTRLALDSGYVSRLLRRLESAGLATTEADPADGRRRIARLTLAGEREWDTLDQLSDQQVRAIVGPLGERRAGQLADALTLAGRLVGAASITLEAVDARSDDAQRSMAAYFAELDDLFPTGFDPGDALTADAHTYDPPAGTFVVAYTVDRQPVGCGGMWTMEPGTGEIKRMWVAPEWRGVGLAGRLLADLEGRSRACGHARTVLDTNAVLHDAIAMYERSGYEPIERYNDNPYAQRWFEKRW